MTRSQPKGCCYLFHIHPPYKHAAHYLGWAQDLAPRVDAHLAGQGARLTQVALAAGCSLTLVRIWQDVDSVFERQLKQRKNATKQLCPVCRGTITIAQARQQFNHFTDA